MFLTLRQRPNPDAVFGHGFPIQQLAGILLAQGSNIAMAQEGIIGDLMARLDIPTQFYQRLDLRFGKFAVAEFMPGIYQLDADRMRIDISDSAPEAFPGMPGTLAFIHEAQNPPVFLDKIMGAY